jgi:hypothetical protein
LFYWLVLLCCFDLRVCVRARVRAFFFFFFALLFVCLFVFLVVVFDELVKFEIAGYVSFVASFFLL